MPKRRVRHSSSSKNLMTRQSMRDLQEKESKVFNSYKSAVMLNIAKEVTNVNKNNWNANHFVI